MKAAVVALFLVVLPASSRAQETASVGTDGFRSLAAAISADPSVAGQWVVLLPAIARQCDMTVDPERVTALVNTFAAPEAVDEAADYYANRRDGRLKASWDAIAKRDQDSACQLADSLWGEAGGLFAGVLRDDQDGPAPAASQRAASGRVP